uniref:Uncharacterized protein n=1 Tax=Periophthalmus magnuspinnatus TaxID=409849 RepID=A0A3B4AI72_9GOBI
MVIYEFSVIVPVLLIVGQMLDNRTQSPWRLSLLSDLFWGAVEFFSLFTQPLWFSSPCSPPGPPGGRRRMGRITHGGGPNAPPMGGGGG